MRTEAAVAWNPRPDQPEKHDQQTAFIESQARGMAFLLGGNGAGTTEALCAKVAEFVTSIQEPPRPDTPFWLIAGSYEQVCEAVWKEKLYGHGHIAEDLIDWERVSWLKPSQNWPTRVPLKPWPGKPGKNWVLEFKSWRQGRQQMQARSIGGFAFSEQYPWELFEEVYRGCREYSFVGNKIAEFTPIDPEMSFRLQEMIENDAVPAHWDVFHANTECARDAGHVSAEWYEDFFGMVPDEMLKVRQIGEFAGFEGVIYPGFDTKLHCPDDRLWRFPPDSTHRRAIDWGYGGAHAFCCLWAYKDPLGRWWIYDELYERDYRRTNDNLKAVSERSRDEWGWRENDPHFGICWADSADPDAIETANKFEEDFPDYPSISMQGAPKRVNAGIEVVQSYLKIDPKLGTPRLFIHPTNCPNLKREMRTYRWERPSGETGANPKDPRKVPVKKGDHAVDPLRYLLHAEDNMRGATAIERVSKGHSMDPVSGSHGVRLHKQGA